MSTSVMSSRFALYDEIGVLGRSSCQSVVPGHDVCCCQLSRAPAQIVQVSGSFNYSKTLV